MTLGVFSESEWEEFDHIFSSNLISSGEKPYEADRLNSHSMYGGLGRSAKKLLKLISKCARDQMLMWPYHRIIQNLKGEIAISIQRGNAIAILAGYNRAIGKPAKLHMGRGDAAA